MRKRLHSLEYLRKWPSKKPNVDDISTFDNQVIMRLIDECSCAVDLIIAKYRDLFRKKSPVIVVNDLDLDLESIIEVMCFIHSLARENIDFVYSVKIENTRNVQKIFHATEYLPLTRIFMYSHNLEVIALFAKKYVTRRYSTAMIVPFVSVLNPRKELSVIEDYMHISKQIGFDMDKGFFKQVLSIMRKYISATPREKLSPAIYISLN